MKILLFNGNCWSRYLLSLFLLIIEYCIHDSITLLYDLYLFYTKPQNPIQTKSTHFHWTWLCTSIAFFTETFCWWRINIGNYLSLGSQTHTQPFNGPFSRTTWVGRYQKDKPFWILLKQEMTGWQWHQPDHMQIICTSLQSDIHASTSSLHIFYRPDALPAAQPTPSQHWLGIRQSKRCQFMSTMHEHAFGGRALPGPAGGANVLLHTH